MTADEMERAAFAGLDAMEAEFGGEGWQRLAVLPGALDLVRYIDPHTGCERQLTADEKAYIRMRGTE